MIKLVNFLHEKFPEIFNENEYETLLKEVEEEKQELSALTTERDLLLLPDTVGALLQNHAFMNKTNSQFYKDHPEYKDKKELVASVIESVEGQHPFEKYDKLMELALPEIKRRAKLTSNLNMTSVVNEPDRDLSDTLNHGVL